jgi:restriction system protein
MKLLQRYPEYVAWRSAAVKGRVKPQTEPKSEDQTPEEMIAEGYEKLKDSLGADILDHVKSCSPRFFERLVVKLLTRMGYGSALENAGRVVGRTGDGGIDGIIKEDKLGLDSIYIQAKRWEGSVGAGQVRDFAGSLDYHGAKKGVFITTSSFTKEARDFVGRLGEKKIVLIDGDQLADLMIEYDIGVSTVDTYQIKKVDSDYFEE